MNLGLGGFPFVTHVFHRCNAPHRINRWDRAPEAWTAVRRGPGHRRRGRDGQPYPGGVPVLDPAQAPSAHPADASFGRRLAAFAVDWTLCLAATFLVLPYDLVLDPGGQPDLLLGVPESSWAVLGVFFALNVVFVGFTGSTPGHRLLRLQVWQSRPGPFPLQVVVRSLLTALVVPAIVPAGNGRFLHDALAGTRIVRPGAARA